MELNNFAKPLLSIGRWLAKTLLCVAAVTVIGQGAFFSNAFSNSAAMAEPATNLVATADVGDRVQDKASEDAGRAKKFIRDTANRVERTAKDNADRVGQADERGGVFERRAREDAARIERRAEEDAARTQRAVDDSKNVLEQAVDNIKDAFGN